MPVNKADYGHTDGSRGHLLSYGGGGEESVEQEPLHCELFEP